jgi:hypothetical protein
LSYLARYDEAIIRFEACVTEEPDSLHAAYNLAVASVRGRGLAYGDNQIQRLEVVIGIWRERNSWAVAYAEAGLAALRDERGSALLKLSNAVSENPLAADWARRDPAWTELRDNVEFLALMSGDPV